MTVIGECERCARDVIDSEDYFIDGDVVQHERCYDDDPPGEEQKGTTVSTIYLVTVYPYDTDPATQTYAFTDEAGAKEFIDHLKTFYDSVFLAGGGELYPLAIEPGSMQDALDHFVEYYGASDDD